MNELRRNRVLSVLLAMQGGLVLLGAILLGLTGSVIFPFDTLVGADASVAALVLGAGLVMAFRHPSRAWVNLAIMYDGLSLIVQGLRYSHGNLGAVAPKTVAVSALFLAAFVVFYPRSGTEIVAAG